MQAGYSARPCPRPEKVKHRTLEDALAVVGAVDWKVQLAPYKCRCGYYHVSKHGASNVYVLLGSWPFRHLTIEVLFNRGAVRVRATNSSGQIVGEYQNPLHYWDGRSIVEVADRFVTALFSKDRRVTAGELHEFVTGVIESLPGGDRVLEFEQSKSLNREMA